MMKLKNYAFLLVFAVLSFTANAQQVPNEPMGPSYVSTSNSMYHVPSLASRAGSLIPAAESEMPKDKRHFGNQVVIGKDQQTQNDRLASNPHPSTGSLRVAPPSLVFDAITNVGLGDPDVGIGPNHVFVVFNTGFRIFDKAGTPLTGQLNPNNIFTNSDVCCDLTVSYDNAADRWVVTILSSTGAGNGGNFIQVAVSDGSNPVTSGWNSYQFNMNTDYQKLSVWSDAYYITANKGGSELIHALDRDALIAGAATVGIQGFGLPGISTSGFFSPQAFNVADDNLPAPGGATFVYLQDDAYPGVPNGNDHIKLWTVDIDWVTPGNSTVSANTEFPVTEFIGVFDGGSFSNLAQPGGSSIDALQATIMNQAMFRKFPTHNSAVFDFVVDADATGGELAAIRWYEFRQSDDNMPWTMFQEGTYTAPNGRHAWMGSMAIDGAGNIGMGYTSMTGPTSTGPTVRVSAYYTGRFDGDALGTMTIAEEVISNGTGNIPGNRYGDYGKLDIDPADDSTFWFADEYVNGSRNVVIGAFELIPPAPDDVGVLTIDTPVTGVLTATEDVTITIRNFGSNDITNPIVQYTIDGGAAEIETTDVGTIAAGATTTYTFNGQADLSGAGPFVIVAKTNLPGDSDTSNDDATKTVEQVVGYCEPEAVSATGTGCNVDGIKKFVLGDIDADDGADGCNTEPASGPRGYADRTNLSTVLSNQAGSNVYILQAQQNWDDGAGVEALSVWIDFDDSESFEPSEQLISGEFFQSFDELEDFTLTIPTTAALGSHRLRARAFDTSGPGDVDDPCGDYDFGETQDYTVIIEDILAVEDVAIETADFQIVSKPNKQYEISLTTEFDGVASIAIYNVTGQIVAFNNLDKENGSFNYALDMSYAPSGVYLIRMGDQRSKSFKTGKIIVE